MIDLLHDRFKSKNFGANVSIICGKFMRKCEKNFFFVKILIPLHRIWPLTHGGVVPCSEPPAVYHSNYLKLRK